MEPDWRTMTLSATQCVSAFLLTVGSSLVADSFEKIEPDQKGFDFGVMYVALKHCNYY